MTKNLKKSAVGAKPKKCRNFWSLKCQNFGSLRVGKVEESEERGWLALAQIVCKLSHAVHYSTAVETVEEDLPTGKYVCDK